MNCITLFIVIVVVFVICWIFNIYYEMRKKQQEHELSKIKEIEKTKRLAILVQNLKVATLNPLSKNEIEDLIK